MSEEQLKAFWEAIQTDPSLQEKLRAATDADSIASIAKEAGFEIRAEEIKRAQSELSDEQLDGVAGGWWNENQCWCVGPHACQPNCVEPWNPIEH